MLRRRSETAEFCVAMMRLRHELGWNQASMAARLGVSTRTLSHWECGHWLPPHKERIHIVLQLHQAPPEHVLTIANSLGVSANPTVAPLLQPYRDALDGTTNEAPPAPPAPRVAPAPEHLRAAVDAVVREAADSMNVLTNDLRATIGRALAACAAHGATLEETQAAVAVVAKPAKRG